MTTTMAQRGRFRSVLSKLCCGAIWLAISVPALGQPQFVEQTSVEQTSVEQKSVEQKSAEQTRPKVGLVLSGGGARGAAHVGVINVLDELRIPIDFIAGASMGAIVGGLYASGISAPELEQILDDTDWPKQLADRPPRAQRSYRRKSDDFGFLVNFDLGIDRQGLIFPRGIVQGQTLTLYLRRLLLSAATIDDFDQLPIPFRAIATDIELGGTTVLGSGDLSMAIRASMSAPGIFKPVRLDDRLLVDGGVANNLPVDVVKAMGADILIVVDVGFPLISEEELDSPLKVTSQMLTILINARSDEQKQLMASGDVLISPPLGQLGSQAFDQTGEAKRIGELAARQSAAKLSRLSLSPRAYAEHRRSIGLARSGVPRIDQVTIENDSRLSTQVLQTRLTDYSGALLDVSRLESEIADIYGLDTFETVDYSVRAKDAGNELLIRTKDKSWGPNYLRFGINLEDDFDGTSSYNLAARITKTEINQLGGELQADFVLGESPQAAFELFQPLDYRSRWFVNPRISLNRSNTALFDDGRQIAEFRSEDLDLSLGIGRQFGNWGELRFTAAHSQGDSKLNIGDPALAGDSGDLSTLALDFAYDTIDYLPIPRSGTSFNLGWLGLRKGFGADQTIDIGQAFMLKPQTWGNHTLLHWWNVGSVVSSDDIQVNAFQLGGLFNLSGYASGELEGQHLAIGRMLYYRRVGQGSMPLLDTPIYLGASLEVGNVWQDRDAISASDSILAGSAFVVIDSLLGPLYLAYGAAEGQRRSAYLFLGQTF